MQINKAKTYATFAGILLMLSAILMALPVGAQSYIDQGLYGMGWWGESAKNLQPNGGQRLPAGVTPDVEFKVDVYISVRPKVVGVGQPVLVNIWTVPGPSFTRYFTDYKVIITMPNGTQVTFTIDSYRADSTAWFEWYVDQPGTWKFKWEFPGQYFPAGNYTTPAGVSYAGYTESYTKSLYYKPTSSRELTVVAREEIVYSWPESTLPTDYWVRPAAKEHREWWTILGDYPWRGPAKASATWDKLYPKTSRYWSCTFGFLGREDSNQRFTPWVLGPESAHVVWKVKDQLSGILGGDQGYKSITYTGTVPTIVYQGMGYRTVTKPFDGTTQSVWQCFDLRTGEIYWERIKVSAPTVIEYGEGMPAVPGGEAAVGITPALVYIGGGRLIKYTPATGAVTLNVSISPLTTGTYYRNGYVLSVQTLSSTGGPGLPGSATAGIYRLINWTTFGTTSNFKSRIVSNISWPRADLGDLADFEAGIVYRCVEKSWFDTPVTGFPYAFIPYDNATGFRYGLRIKAYDLKTGNELWDKEFFNSIYHPTASIAQFGKIAVLVQDQETANAGGYYMCFNGRTGDLLWTSEQMDYPWDICGFGAYGIATAYGLFYRFGYSGIYAFNWTNGKIEWKYEAKADSPYESPYIGGEGDTVYSFNAAGWVADGKLYAYNTEHTPTQPITRGWGIHCLNATTGELIWKTKIWGTIGPIVDGYLTVGGYDGYMYVFGKGKSETTVTAAPKTVSKGSTVLIEGSVLDMSPAQSGTPCVSKESMSTWMEYLHLQMPLDGLWHNETITGVPVKLCAIKGNDVIDLGTVTTNGYYGTFSFAWTPPEEGTYTIVASFNGDESYASSSAATAITVGPAPPTPETPEIPTPTDYTPMLTALAIAVIIAIVIGIANLYALIKRK
jgi:hypothetical protein